VPEQSIHCIEGDFHIICICYPVSSARQMLSELALFEIDTGKRGCSQLNQVDSLRSIFRCRSGCDQNVRAQLAGE
jgi:hypothetical protein